jgi:homocysteine S-methyltransferase
LKHKVGAVLDGVHYRASRDWGELLGYSRAGLEEVVIQGIEFYKDLAREYETEDSPMPISGVVGPRGDAYSVGRVMNAIEAEDYHSEQMTTMKNAGADMITA